MSPKQRRITSKPSGKTTPPSCLANVCFGLYYEIFNGGLCKPRKTCLLKVGEQPASTRVLALINSATVPPAGPRVYLIPRSLEKERDGLPAKQKAHVQSPRRAIDCTTGELAVPALRTPSNLASGTRTTPVGAGAGTPRRFRDHVTGQAEGCPAHVRQSPLFAALAEEAERPNILGKWRLPKFQWMRAFSLLKANVTCRESCRRDFTAPLFPSS